MSALTPQFHRGGVHLPKLGLWLDPHEAKTGPERVFISHAHSDHLAAHREVILSAPTARLMRSRLGGERRETVLAYGEARAFADGGCPYRLTLLPAGHIFGSAMAFIEAENSSLLYTGDFKLRRGFSAEACQPRPAEHLVMETTFGRPEYQFPPAEAVLQAVIRFCREALDNEETPVLLGYSLGKSQELLCGLADAGLPLLLHSSAHRMTQIYEEFGQHFPKYEVCDAPPAPGHVLICPPGAAATARLRHQGRVRTAVLTGWSVHPSLRYRYGTDAAFPLSDHADFPDLVAFVKQVAPRRVYTLHGFAADFAQTLRDLGFDARALSEPEQMGLALKFTGSAAPPRSPVPTRRPTITDQTPNAQPSTLNSFRNFAETCANIAATGGKLEKTRLLAEYLRTLPEEDFARAVVWFAGPPFAGAGRQGRQLGWALMRDALGAAARISAAEFHRVYLTHCDLGETAFELFQNRPGRGPGLTLAEAQLLFEELHAARGSMAKRTRLSRAFEQCTAREAKYLVKLIHGGLRIGLKEDLVKEAAAQACNTTPGAVQAFFHEPERQQTASTLQTAPRQLNFSL